MANDIVKLFLMKYLSNNVIKMKTSAIYVICSIACTNLHLERNQSSCVPAGFVQGRRSLMVASTLVQCFRDTPTLVSL